MTSKGYTSLDEPHAGPKSGGIRSWLRRGHSLQPRPHSQSEKPLLNEDAKSKYEAQWGIHWQTPVSIIGLLLVGIGAGISHHLFYKSLDRQSAANAINQQLATRIGTALAFLLKATLVAAIGVSRKQLIWYALRRKSMTLDGIDGLFGVASDPTHFLNLDMILKAPLSSFMAIVMWTIPLSSIVAPGSISIAPGIVEMHNVSCRVPTVKYAFDKNSTAVLDDPDTMKLLVNRPHGKYVGPSHDAIAGYEAMVYGWGSLVSEEVFDGCPDTSDCRYSLSMMLSGLSCAVEAWDLWPISDLAENFESGNFTNITTGTYPVFIAVRDEDEPHENDILWIGHSQGLPDNQTHVNYTLSWCANSIARVNFNVSYSGGYLDMKNASAEQAIPINKTAVRESADPNEYDTAYALFDAAVGMFGGKIEADTTGATLSTNNTKIRLLTGPTSVGNVTTEDLLMRIMIASGHMATVPAIFKDIEARAYLKTRCNYTNYVNIYIYNRQNLLFAYLFATVMTILMAFMGFYALAKNGVASDVNFSTILLTTRNTDLDELAEGSCLGGNPLPERLKKEEMMFGVIKEPTTQEAGHTAIGRANGKNHVMRLFAGKGRYA